ncbi:Asp-tRNA(Asn)/Glu-tRNA(Gln) amidotransferase subunit GatA [Calycomorphotria hydatis]|uniref:Glutamyl-tRNA(Gln) amidotransferase subunit A n=1 Tax=Calycomorphotria hydatis TaxID=2528027 RepID=A0A517TAK8_9PLAN|nr:Asp-tRNA(Asn)/Glu-tRNA(Gln) amidotransferase subunit GatA [Calycomorphotria hydatis]QDT65409.1 Glutamyl-tRNA(Gln) amidotransferase subunit A [Calycomorphotria hydatis]
MAATWIDSSAHDIHQAFVSGEAGASEIAGEFLARIDEFDSDVGAFLSTDRDDVGAQCEALEAKKKSGESLGSLAGVPVAVKDVLCDTGQPCTCGSRMLENFVPPYTGHAVQKLRDADAIIIGRTNMDEFAMGSSTENSYFKQTHNPWDLKRAPGGSSGGSAAAVAASMAPLSLGTDTGGSIRQPAGFCGVVGLKPTYGRVSRYGLVAFASSLDQIGPFAHDVTGAAMLLQAIAGHDDLDSTSVDVPVPDYLAELDQPIKGLKIGIVNEHFVEGLDPEVEAAIRTAIEVYESLGAEVKQIELPHSKYAVATYYIIAPSEASSNLARYDGIHYGYRAEKFDDMIDLYARSRGEAFGPEVKRRIMLGTYALSAGYADQYYNQALKVRRLIRRDFDLAFADVDVVLSPVTPTPAFELGELVDDPLAMYLSDIYTISANLAGIPGISIPAGQTAAGLPVGMQLLAGPLQEEKLLRAARMFEKQTDWHTLRAPLGQ